MVQRNAATVANATMYRQLPCRCRYGDPTNIYSYDNRYAPACYLNSAACNLHISALYTPTLLRDLCFAPTFRLPPFVAAICPIDLQLCIHNVGSFNVRICLFSGIVRNCYTESISLTKIVLRFVTTVLFIITKYIRCFASLSILRKTEYQSKNRNMKNFCPTTTRTCKMIDSEATFINSIDWKVETNDDITNTYCFYIDFEKWRKYLHVRHVYSFPFLFKLKICYCLCCLLIVNELTKARQFLRIER